VRPDDEKVLPDYLSACLAGTAARTYFLRSAKQTTGIASINMTQLRAAPVSVPPLVVQQRFLELSSSVVAKRQVVESARSADVELFASLQSRAFRGEL
jgi:type I restriction enzyme S subunit